MKNAAFLAVACLVTASSLQAQYTEVDITSDINADIQTYTDGNNYQLGGTTLTVAGVPFALAELNSTAGTTGVIQTPSSAGGFPPVSSSGPYDYTFSVPGGTHANALYSLANTAFGSAGVVEGSLVVTGTGGETATLTLTEGGNIRDHNNDGFVNTLSDSTVVPTYFLSGAPTTSGSIQTRLDRQELILPSTFNGDTIASIEFVGTANGGDGEAFLAALTLGDVSTSTVPDGALPFQLTAGMFLAILVAAGIRRNQFCRCS